MPGAQNKQISAMTGKNATLVITQESAKRLISFKSWTVKPNVTKHADAINGAATDEPDITFNLWEISGQVYARDADWLEAYLESLAARQANTAPLEQAGGVRFKPNDGSKASYVLVGLVWDDFDANNGGRAEKMMVTVNLRCTTIKKAKSL